MDLDTVKSLLECPVCLEMASPPIYNCRIGHIICHNCCAKVKNCPVCREDYLGTRNFVAEKLASKCDFSCRNAGQGCTKRLKGDSIAEHEEKCDFRPINCNIPFCKTGSIKYIEYFDHLISVHGMQVAPNNNATWEREMPAGQVRQLLRDSTRKPAGMNVFGQRFIQCLNADDSNIWIWVCHCGQERDNKSYETTLKIRSKLPGETVEMTWTGPVHHVRKTGSEVLNSGLCLMTSPSVLKSLVSYQNGQRVWYLEITVRHVTTMFFGYSLNSEKSSSIPKNNSTNNPLIQKFKMLFKNSS